MRRQARWKPSCARTGSAFSIGAMTNGRPGFVLRTTPIYGASTSMATSPSTGLRVPELMAVPQPQVDASLSLISSRQSPSWTQIVQLIAVLIFLALSTFRFLFAPLDRFDEGVTLTKAALVASGHVPFRDFWATYGPLDSYLLAAAFKLFTPNVVVERVMGALLVPAIGLIAYALMRYIRLQAGLRLLLTGLIAMVPLAVPAFNNAFLANAIGLAAVLAF